jgi:hypothetical protein
MPALKFERMDCVPGWAIELSDRRDMRNGTARILAPQARRLHGINTTAIAYGTVHPGDPVPARPAPPTVRFGDTRHIRAGIEDRVLVL